MLEQIVLYEYQQSCWAEHLTTLPKAYTGYLYADGCAEYYKLPGIAMAAYWVYVRWKYEEVLLGISKHSDEVYVQHPAQEAVL